MVAFNWLHLTDLHVGMREQDWILPGLKDRFFDDLKKLYEKCGPWDLVLFTGDLTQKGAIKEFNKFNNFLEELWKKFHEWDSKPWLLAVPGNHDLVRPQRRTKPSSDLEALLRWDQVQDSFWSHQMYNKPIKTAFKNYLSWWENQKFKPGDNLNNGILPGDFSFTLEKDGAKLGIVGLNSSFLQLDETDYEGKLVLHTHQFNAVCDGNGPEWARLHHACLLLTHHPPSWLDGQSRQHLNGEINNHGRFVVHLCGHMHKSVYRELAEGGNNVQRIWQGNSLCGLEYYTHHNEKLNRLHGYTAGRIVLGNQQAQIMFWPREARLQGNSERNFVPDYSINLTDDYNHHTICSFKPIKPYSKPFGESSQNLQDDPTDNGPPRVLNFIDEVSKNYQALILSHRTAILQWYSLHNTLRGFAEILSKYAIPPEDRDKPIPILVWILDFGLDGHVAGDGNAEVAHWNYQIFKAAIQSVASIIPDEHFTSWLGKSHDEDLRNKLRNHCKIGEFLGDINLHLLAWDQLINRVCVIVKGLTESINRVHSSCVVVEHKKAIYEKDVPKDNQTKDDHRDFDIQAYSILATRCPKCWHNKKEILKHSTNIYQNPEPKLETAANGQVQLALENTNITGSLGGFGLYVTLKNLLLDPGNWGEAPQPQYWAWLDRNILDKINHGQRVTKQDRMTALTKREDEVLFDLGPAEQIFNDGMRCAYLAAYYHLMKESRSDLPAYYERAYRTIKNLKYDILTLPEFLTYPKFSM